MSRSNRPKPTLLLLDIIGAILLATGLAELAAGLVLIPGPLRFPGIAWVFVGAGLMLLLPLPLSLLSGNRRKSP